MSNKLPSTYQEVEYIESRKNQYIDTGVLTSNKIRIECEYSTTYNGINLLFGARRNINTNGLTFGTQYANNRNQYYVAYGGETVQRVTTINNNDGNKHKVILSNEVFTIDNENQAIVRDDFTASFSILLGTFLNNNAPDTRMWIGNIYSCKIYDNNNLVRDFVPCYRKSDNKIGFYDLVNDTFYVNIGTGEFIKGSDVGIAKISINKSSSIDWTKSMVQTFEYYIVDPNTWADIKKLDNVKSSSITYDEDTDTLGSASIDITESVGECYIRIYLIAIQNGIKEKRPLGTFLVQTPSSSFNGKVREVTMDAYTSLKELKEKYPPIGYSILEGGNILENAYLITRENARAPVIKAECPDTLQGDFVSEENDNWVTFNSDLLANAKYHYALDEMGRILFAPKQNLESLQPVYTFNDDNSSILYPDINMDHDLYQVPNVVEVIYSSGKDYYYTKVVNDDPNSPTSTVNRGREIPYRETNPDLTGRPTEMQIKEYAENLLKELSSLEYTVTYTHGYCGTRLGDCVRLNYTKAGIKDIKAKIISQTIECSPGCKVTEKAVFTTKLWR